MCVFVGYGCRDPSIESGLGAASRGSAAADAAASVAAAAHPPPSPPSPVLISDGYVVDVYCITCSGPIISFMLVEKIVHVN